MGARALLTRHALQDELYLLDWQRRQRQDRAHLRRVQGDEGREGEIKCHVYLSLFVPSFLNQKFVVKCKYPILYTGEDFLNFIRRICQPCSKPSKFMFSLKV